MTKKILNKKRPVNQKISAIKLESGEYVFDMANFVKNNNANLVLIAEKDAKIKIKEILHGVLNATVSLVVQENAKVELICETSGEKINLVHTISADINAEVNFFEIVYKAEEYCSVTELNLRGIGARGGIFCLFNAVEKNCFEIKHLGNHFENKTDSTLISGGIANGSAQVNFNSLIDIKSNAHNCSGKQKLEAILMSKEARVVAIPDLKIANPDVKCSHSVSIANFDLDKLFYLESRGLGNTQSKELLIKSRLSSALSQIDEIEERERILETMLANMVIE